MIKSQNGNSRMDTVLKLLLIAFISLLAFSSGVFFGKQLSDSDYKLKALESDFQNTPTQLADGNDEYDVNPEEVINEEEVAALSEKMINAKREEARSVASNDESHAADTHDGHEQEAVTDSGSAKSVATHSAKKPTAAASGKPDLSAAHRAATRVANNAVPVVNEKPKEERRLPNSLPKTVGSAHDVEFTVQVASYPTADRAKEHAAELVAKGFPAYHVAATINGRTWFRVSIGSFKSMQEATGYRAQLLKQADLPTAIVQKIHR